MIENCGACGEQVERKIGNNHTCVTHQVCCPDIMGDQDDPWDWRGHTGDYWASTAAETYCDEYMDVDDRAMLSGECRTVRVRAREWYVFRAEPNWGPWVEYIVSGEVAPSYHATRKPS